MKRSKQNRQPNAGMKRPSKVTKAVNGVSWKYYFALAIIVLISFLNLFTCFS